MPPADNQPADGDSGELPSPQAPGQTFGPNGQGQPQPPFQAQPQVYGAPASPMLPDPTSMPVGTRQPGSKKFWFITILVIVLLGVGGGYVFGYYLPNRPSQVYKDSLERTGMAADKLVDYAKIGSSKQYKGSSTDGKFSFTSTSVSGDGTFTAKTDGMNTDAQIKADVAGKNFALNLKSVAAASGDQPDIYFQITGVKSLLDQAGLNSLDTLDGKWVIVDHTLLESLAAKAQGDSTSNAKMAAPSPAQVQDAISKVQVVNKQYIFTSDSTHAVLANPKYVGKATWNNRQTYQYDVGYSKTNLKAYLKAVQAALASSSLNEYVKQSTGKSIGSYDTSGLLKQVDKADGAYRFTMYVDTKTKLVDGLHFKDPKSASYFELGQTYDGGSVYPFVFTVADQTDSKNNMKFTLKASLDSATNQLTVDGKLAGKSDNSPITGSLQFTTKPSNDPVKVTAPTGATPVMDILNQLGLGGFVSGNAASPSDANTKATPFTLTQ